jgi:hypothetical protein
LLVGCGGTFQYREGQAEAERAIWNDVYGMEGPPPPVEWVEDSTVLGNYWGTTLVGWKVRVACRFPGTGPGPCDCNQREDWQCVSVSASAMAHEFMHWRTFILTNGDVDSGHRRGDWDLVYEAQKLAFDRTYPTPQGRTP